MIGEFKILEFLRYRIWVGRVSGGRMRGMGMENGLGVAVGWCGVGEGIGMESVGEEWVIFMERVCWFIAEMNLWKVGLLFKFNIIDSAL